MRSLYRKGRPDRDDDPFIHVGVMWCTDVILNDLQEWGHRVWCVDEVNVVCPCCPIYSVVL